MIILRPWKAISQ